MLKIFALIKRSKYLFIISFLFWNFSYGQITKIDLQLAHKYYLDADYEKAMLYYEKISQEDKYLDKIYKNYKATLIELFKYREAEKLCKDQIKSQPLKLHFLVDLGIIYELDDKPAKKLQLFDKAIAQIKSNTTHSAASDLGIAFEKVGAVDRALETYLKFEKISPRNILSFHSKIAMIYNRQGKTHEMINTFFEMLLLNERFLSSVQNGLVNSIDFETQYKEKEILRKAIIQNIQTNPNKIVFVELLAWYYMLNNDYENAYIQIKSIDKKLNSNGQKVLELGNTALNNKDFNIAIKCFDYIIKNSSSLEIKFEAKNKRLITFKTKLLNGSKIIKEELEELKANYLLALSQLNNNRNVYNNSLRKYQLMVDLSEIEAYFLKDINSAKNHLKNAMSLTNIKAKQKAEAKLKLADIIVLENNIWEASLMYMQIEKEFKNDPLGHLAKFKNAQVYYFSGEYDWCQAQLDVLKASTSKLIANDALELSVLIADNYNMDTSETAMKLFSYADMLSAQQQYKEAIILYDSVLNNFKNHTLNDEIIFRKAKIKLKQHLYNEAIKHLENLEINYPNSILLDNSLYLMGCIYQENIKNLDLAKKYFKTLLFNHPGSLYITDSRKRFRKIAGNTNAEIQKNS
ncbi:MAG: hypothetical protein CL821_02510 [Crocinitomicaceae bacterium]|mgnify:FL=1|nr:hypothetical protein [Crocinitomicaceae bacterium]|tara:strand:+ start:17621 stop:19516 length:1896 start_codon:yes stop_codon:yes gene_type:complete